MRAVYNVMEEKVREKSKQIVSVERHAPPGLMWKKFHLEEAIKGLPPVFPSFLLYQGYVWRRDFSHWEKAQSMLSPAPSFLDRSSYKGHDSGVLFCTLFSFPPSRGHLAEEA